MPEISVIVPVYRVEQYLHRCLNSILTQTYKDFELILVDDGSPDNCGTICDNYAAIDSRIHVIHQKNAGVSAARNAAIDWALSCSESQWLTCVDSDDWIHPRYLELLYKAVCESGSQISMCRYIRKKDSKPSFEMVRDTWQCLNTNDAYILDSNSFEVNSYPWGRLYHKSLFQTVRYPVGRYWEDLATTYKILYTCEQIAVLDDVLYYYYINPTGTTEAPWSPRNLGAMAGYEENLLFFRRRKDSKMELRVARGFQETLISGYTAVQKSALSKREKYRITIHIKWKMFCFMLRYAKRLNMTVHADYSSYYLLFKPILLFYEHATFLRKPYQMLRSFLKK